jgi:hypothetical protein
MSFLLVALEAFAILAVVPAGLAVLTGLPGWVGAGWRWLAPPAALALLLPRGAPAAALTVPWVLLTLGMGLAGAGQGLALLRGGPSGAGWPRVWSRALARFAPAGTAVAGVAHLAERAGVRLFGFDLRTLALTVAHLQVAGFAALLLCSWAAGFAAGHPSSGVRRAGAGGAVLLPLGVLVVLVGYFVSDLVELAGAAAVATGLWAVAAVLWFGVRPTVRDRLTRTLLAVTALVPLPSMALALSWAFGEATGSPHPSLTWMLATHGVANAVGVALCGLLAQRLLRRPARLEPHPAGAAR